jgi:hypothetical protein
VDYIVKPVSPPIVLARVRTHLSLVRASHLERSHYDAIHMLGEAGHYNDNDTGVHIWRMAAYAGALAQAAGLAPELCQQIELAAPMHDTGKIGISNAILQEARQARRCRMGGDQESTPASATTSWPKARRRCLRWPQRLRCTTTNAGTARATRTDWWPSRSRCPPALWRWPTCLTPWSPSGRTKHPGRSSACWPHIRDSAGSHFEPQTGAVV